MVDKNGTVPLRATAGSQSGVIPPDVSRELVEHYCRNEWAICPDDIMFRRAGWQHYLTNANRTALQVAEWMANS